MYPELSQNEKDVIICSRCVIDKKELLLGADKPVGEAEAHRIICDYSSLLDGEPLQYITGKCDFYGLELYVDRNVLIPRFDTELIVEYCIESIPHGVLFADLCCGSGCIGLAILKNRPDLRCVSVDISEKALSVCEKNARLLGVGDRCEIICADVKNGDIYKKLFEISYIVSNPPYIPTEDIEKLDVTVRHEPHSALDGGADGLDFYRTIIALAYQNTRLEHIIFEIGYDEGEALRAIARRYSARCEILKDLCGNDRCAVINFE